MRLGSMFTALRLQVFGIHVATSNAYTVMFLISADVVHRLISCEKW